VVLNFRSATVLAKNPALLVYKIDRPKKSKANTTAVLYFE